jgi:hypothetical protein
LCSLAEVTIKTFSAAFSLLILSFLARKATSRSSGADQEKPIKFDQMYPNNRHFEGLKRHFQPPNQA